MNSIVRPRNWQVIQRYYLSVPAIVVMTMTPLFGQHPLRVIAQPANAIRAESATINGTVLTGSSPATTWFEWGTSREYGHVIGSTNLSTSDQVISLQHTLSGLSPDYVYHFRLVASNSTGIVTGADQQFTLGGTVVVWGNPSFGATIVPSDLTNVVAIGGGGYHCAVLRNDGTVRAWGGDAYGQATVPPDLSNVVAIAVGQVHNLALLSDRTVRAWGAGATLSSSFPEGGQSIVPPGLSNVVQIAAGTTHSLALKADGTVVAWGSARLYLNAWSDLGQSQVPADLSNVVAIAGGDFHNTALKADGTVVIWGYTDYGQGDTPSDLSNVVAIAAGWYHNFGLRDDQSLVGWGYNNYFEVSGMPFGLDNVAGITGGGFHSLAVLRDGSLAGWGDDSAGQIDFPSNTQNATVAASRRVRLQHGIAFKRAAGGRTCDSTR